jgi:hypothetical protein
MYYLSITAVHKICIIDKSVKDYSISVRSLLQIFSIHKRKKVAHTLRFFSQYNLGSIEKDLREIGWDHMNWIDLAQDRN